MNIKKIYPLLFTYIVYTLIVSTVSPVVAVNPTPAPSPEEDFSETTTPKPTVKPEVLPASTQKATATTSATLETEDKYTAYKGTISATPSAVGKFLVMTDSGEKNIDTDKKTKVYSVVKDKKVTTIVSKLKVNDTVAVVGFMSKDNKTLLARFIILNSTDIKPERKAMYGSVASREASGSGFILQIKGAAKDDKQEAYTVDDTTNVKVKSNDSAKLSDIKIGDRVTFTYVQDEKTKENTIAKIFVIPGRASGLLKDIRETTASAEKQTAESTTSATDKTATNSAKPTTTPTAKPTP